MAAAERFWVLAVACLGVSLILPITASLMGAQNAPQLPSAPAPPENPFQYEGNPLLQNLQLVGDWLWVVGRVTQWLGSYPTVFRATLAALGIGEPWTTVLYSFMLVSAFAFVVYVVARITL
ncbi:MAG: hypothetical protein NZ954_08510 [Thermofilaceae archaeon]|nr:hypothetical protein [Thermofilaceae archaeon]MDW8004963.1 hypothetical protein [Thermofilaceae archaeon]